MNNHRTKKKEEKLVSLESVIQDFEKEKPQYEHLENPKYNKYNKIFKELKTEADTLKNQGKIEESIRKYKKTISYASTILRIHKNIENRKENPQYYKNKKRIWLLSISIIIMLIISMALGIFLGLDLSLLVNVLLISILIMMILSFYVFLKSPK